MSKGEIIKMGLVVRNYSEATKQMSIILSQTLNQYSPKFIAMYIFKKNYTIN